MKPSRGAAAIPQARRPSVAIRFRTEIETAAAEGLSLEDLTLHLTLGDVEQLKRDRTLPVSDISFFGGRMTYLGVKVLKGDVPASVLLRPAAEAV